MSFIQNIFPFLQPLVLMRLILLAIAWCYVPVCPHRKSIHQPINRSTRIFGVVFYINFFFCVTISCSTSFKTLSHSITIVAKFSCPMVFPVWAFVDRGRGDDFRTDVFQIIQSWDCSIVSFSSWGETSKKGGWQFHFGLFKFLELRFCMFLILASLIKIFGWIKAPPFIAIGSEEEDSKMSASIDLSLIGNQVSCCDSLHLSKLTLTILDYRKFVFSEKLDHLTRPSSHRYFWWLAFVVKNTLSR